MSANLTSRLTYNENAQKENSEFIKTLFWMFVLKLKKKKISLASSCGEGVEILSNIIITMLKLSIVHDHYYSESI